MSVLIVSSPSDVHAQAVERHLRSMNTHVEYLEVAQLLQATRCVFELGQDRSALNIQASDDHAIDLNQIQSVWLRRGSKVRSPHLPQPWMEAMVEWESTRALNGIYRTMPCRWINPPAREEEALHKLWQLDVARQCGLLIPKTIVTNDPEAVLRFYEQCSGQLVYKLIDEASLRYFPSHEVPRGMPTLPFRTNDLEHVSQVKRSLHLFQAKIAKQFDVRVTVVGKTIFAAKIDSQKTKGAVDFRLDYSAPLTQYKLPDEVARSCLLLMKRLGLVFGAIDFGVDDSQHHHFFEVNPAGQFLWIEKALDVPISRELAKLLAKASR